MSRTTNILRSPDRVVLLWLAVWWVANIVTAAASELANDEAYYHLFAGRLDWGYFDHPPVTALLVRGGEYLFGGELGVRFLFTLLQPLCLWVFWRTIRPADASHSDAALYAMICAAIPVLHLYGFVAVPDGPLLLSAALFFAAFKAFAGERRLSWLWLGLSTGLMAYCKYHGALVLIFTLAANAGWLLRRPRRLALLAAGGAVAVAMLIPHLWWQYRHDWISFAYHLSWRNGGFRLSNITDFVLSMAAIFSPFYLPLWVQSWRKVRAVTPLERALKVMPPAIILFFALTAVRGHVQPQWAIAALFGLVWLLFDYARRHRRTRRYVMRAGAVSLLLVVLLRVVLIFNPSGVKFEVFDNRESYARIAEVAAGRPVIFDNDYAVAAKYAFYCPGAEVFAQPDLHYRTSQWQLRDDDRRFAGREVLVLVDSATYPLSAFDGDCLHIGLKNGHTFSGRVIADFRPTREVEVSALRPLPSSARAGGMLPLALRLTNPYPYDISVDGREFLLEMVWRHRKEECWAAVADVQFTIPAGGSVEVECSVKIPAGLPAQRYTAGFVLRHKDMSSWFCGRTKQIEIRN